MLSSHGVSLQPNKCTHAQVSNACAAADDPLPAVLPLPGGTDPVNTTLLAAITGRRFLTPLSISEARANSSTPIGAPPLKRLKPDDAEPAGAALPESERAAWHSFAALVACRAPDALSVIEMIALVDIVLLVLADCLVSPLVLCFAACDVMLEQCEVCLARGM